jgi:hypothetical protein
VSSCRQKVVKVSCVCAWVAATTEACEVDRRHEGGGVTGRCIRLPRHARLFAVSAQLLPMCPRRASRAMLDPVRGEGQGPGVRGYLPFRVIC